MISINTQSSIKIDNIYFDPYKIKEKYEDAEIIFITHSHYDHFDISSINNIKNENTIIVIPNDESILNELDFDQDKILIVEPNQSYEINNIKFNTIPSYNINKSFHKKEYNWVGYIINYNNESYYIMGDTDATDESKTVQCDKLFIPIGGTYTMDYLEASNLTNIIQPKEVYPIHYGSIVGDISLGEQFSNLIDKNIKVNILIK
jgi:L-ascorbate metabolism protein UlaG (beta-lactamase superfamily)